MNPDSSEIQYWIGKSLLSRVYTSLGDGLESLREQLAEHDRTLGRTTNKNKWWAESLEQQIAATEAVLADLPDTSGNQ